MDNTVVNNVARVVGFHGQRAQLYLDGRVVDAISRGRVKYGEESISPIAVGDYVNYTLADNQPASIEKILPRRTAISRPAVARDNYEQVLVANIDRILIIGSIAEPAFKPGLIDRFLVIAFKEKIHPVVVINKIDLMNLSEIASYTDAWKRLSCDVIGASAATGENIELLANLIVTGTSVVCGHSGVGKSSLLNRIRPDLNLKTKEISLSSQRGVHTTTTVKLHKISADGWVADTPGLKDFGISGISKKSLRLYFPEFADTEPFCQFSDCMHVNEPNCAVKKAVHESNSPIAEFRYKNYVNIYHSIPDPRQW